MNQPKNISEFEQLLISQIKDVVENIINIHQKLAVSAKARAGAEISDWLEEKFVEYTKAHQYFKNSESAPKGQTKHPWDARTYFVINSIIEEIWIDFKAIKAGQLDSNPDIGTPTKVIKFIKEGKFYLIYVYVYYQSTASGLEFIKMNNSYCKVYLLKDISSTVRRNPKNQLQVNVSAPVEYRSRENFIILLINKPEESHKRQIEISQKHISSLEKLKEELIDINKQSELEILKKLEGLN